MWTAAASDAAACLAGAPGERGEVAVVAARRVVPVDAEAMHVAPGGLGQGEPGCGRMTNVVEVDRLARVGARDALDGEVEHARNRDRPAHPAGLDLDRLRLDAAEPPDQGTECTDRSPTL